MQANDAFEELFWTSSDGLRLYSRVYDRAGPAAPVIMCLPGFTENSRDFEDLAAHLASGYQVICPDLRGRGRSDRDPVWQNYQPATYFDDLAAFVAQRKIRRLTIVGTSLGGLLAMLLATRDDFTVTGVVLNDIGPEVDPRGIERLKTYAGNLPVVRSWGDAVAEMRGLFEAAWPGLSEETWMLLTRRNFREDAAGVPVFEVDPKVGTALLAQPAGTGDLWAVFDSLQRVPMLVIRGGLSDILSEATLQRMQREKPDLQTLIVPNRGHVPLLDEPQPRAAIDDFLARLDVTNARPATDS